MEIRKPFISVQTNYMKKYLVTALLAVMGFVLHAQEAKKVTATKTPPKVVKAKKAAPPKPPKTKQLPAEQTVKLVEPGEVAQELPPPPPPMVAYPPKEEAIKAPPKVVKKKLPAKKKG